MWNQPGKVFQIDEKRITIPVDVSLGLIPFSLNGIGPFILQSSILNLNALIGQGATNNFRAIRSVTFAFTCVAPTTFIPGLIYLFDTSSGWLNILSAKDQAIYNPSGSSTPVVTSITGSINIPTNSTQIVLAQAAGYNTASATVTGQPELLGRIMLNNFEVEPYIYSGTFQQQV